MTLRLALAIFAIAIISAAHAISENEIPLPNVTLSGGPANGEFEIGQNFLLNCSVTFTTEFAGCCIQLGGKFDWKWTPTVSFARNGKILGQFKCKPTTF